VGDIFTGKVSRMTNFGAFVELMPGKDGLLRSEEMGDIESDIDVGVEVTVMILEIDNMGRLNLSRRALFGEDGTPRPQPQRPAPRPSFGDRGGDRRPGPGGPRPGGSGPPSGRSSGFGGNRDRRPGPGGPGGPRQGGGGPRPGGSRPSGGGPTQERRFLGGSGSANRQRGDR